VAVKHISEIFQCQAVALLPDEKAKLHVAAGDFSSVFHKDIIKELGVAQGHTRPDKWPVGGLKACRTPHSLCAPARGQRSLRGSGPYGLEIWKRSNGCAEQLRLRLLESLAKQVAMALEVERLQETALESQVAVETNACVPPCGLSDP